MDKMYTLDDINSQAIVKIAKHFLESGLSLRKFCDAYGSFSYITLREKFLTVLLKGQKRKKDKMQPCIYIIKAIQWI